MCKGYLDEVKTRINASMGYAFYGDKFSFIGERFNTPKILRDLEDEELKRKVINLSTLVLNFLSGFNARKSFIPLMRDEEVAGINLINKIHHCGIDYDTRLSVLYRLIGNGEFYNLMDALLLDFCVILHFNLKEKELRSYMSFKSKFMATGDDKLFVIPDEMSVPEYLSILVQNSDFHNILFEA